MKKKEVDYLNLNITFDKEPLLNYFDTIFMPSLEKNYLQSKENKKISYKFEDLKVEEIEGEYILHGLIIKSTTLVVNSQLDENKNLKKADKSIESAPYSMFILFLKNHSMLVIKNQKGSPNAKNIKKAFNDNINTFVDLHNRDVDSGTKKGGYLPNAIVNITGISSEKYRKKVFSEITSIKKVMFNFFDLNGDENFNDEFGCIQEVLFGKMEAEKGTLEFNKPKNKENTLGMINSSSGYANYNMEAKGRQGEYIKITDIDLRKSKKIKTMEENIVDDKNTIIKNILKDKFFKREYSKEAIKIFDNNKDKIKKYI